MGTCRQARRPEWQGQGGNGEEWAGVASAYRAENGRAHLEHSAQAERARRERQVLRTPELLEGGRVDESRRNGLPLLGSRKTCPGHLGHEARGGDPDGPVLAHRHGQVLLAAADAGDDCHRLQRVLRDRRAQV